MVFPDPHLDSIDLRGIDVMVVEDDYFIANEICGALRGRGANVLGPVPAVDGGMRLLAGGSIHCAVLDINLHGQFVFGLAAEIQRRGVPVIFTTGYDAAVIPAPLAGCARLEKPINLCELLRAVRKAAVPVARLQLQR